MLAGVVLSGTIAILGEVNVEHPMKLILDAPMAAADMQQPLGRDVFGQEIVAHDRRIGWLAAQAPARSEAPHRNNARKIVVRR